MSTTGDILFLSRPIQFVKGIGPRKGEALEAEGIRCEVIDARFAKPVDWDALSASIRKTRGIFSPLDSSCRTPGNLRRPPSCSARRSGSPTCDRSGPLAGSASPGAVLLI